MKNKAYTLFLTIFLFGFLLEAASAGNMTREKANALFRQKKWAQAQDAYTELFCLFPEDMNIARCLAKAAKENRDYSRAMIFFEQLTARFPSDGKLWKDLADVYAALGNEPAAEHAMGRVKALQKKNKVADKSDLLHVRSWVGAGVFHDDNVFFQPSKKSIQVGDRTFDLSDEKYRAKDSWGGYAWGALAINRQFESRPAWSFVADASGQFRYYFAESDATTTFARLASGLRYAVPDHWATVRGKLGQYTEDFNNDLVQFGVEADMSHRISPIICFWTKGNIVKRKYQDAGNHDAVYGGIGQYLRLFWKKNEFMIGGRFMDNHADSSKYSYDGWQTSAMLNWSFSDNMELLLRASFEKKDYDKPSFQWIYFSRNDEKTCFSARFRYLFTETMSLEMKYSYLFNDSNVDIYDYTRNLVSMGMNWEF